MNLPDACFGLVVDDNGKIVHAAPIAAWAVGKHWLPVRGYFHAKKGLRQWVWVA